MEVPFGAFSSQYCVLFVVCFLWSSQIIIAQTTESQTVTNCLSQSGILNFTTASSNPTAFTTLLDFSLQNLRFTEAGVRKPDVLIFPNTAKEVQAAFQCSVKAGYLLRVRSGGHSYEGISSTAEGPFVIIDLTSMRAVNVDLASKTAWVEAGATVGEIYYAISQATSDYGFPAGVCPTVGSGGHISGGGYGFLSRKYGTAADNVIDAQLVDASGQLLDRSTMGEDLFWALRGGGGGSWGIIVAWRINLVAVTPKVTTFRTWRTGRQQLTNLIYRWQAVAPTAPQELFHAVYMQGTSTTLSNGTTTTDMGASFYGQYLGTLQQTLDLMGKIYPELGLSATDCLEATWADGSANLASVGTREGLLSRVNSNKGYFKAKSDYVRQELTTEVLAGAFQRLEANAGKGYMIFEPYGGIMDTITSNSIAFPHRAGTLFNIQYQAVWTNGSAAADAPLIDWLRGLYAYMQPFVSQGPRAAYINYIDLDLGVAANLAAAQASWGQQYFLGNFPRLAQIKAKVDPQSVFSHPQSVPPS